MKLRNTALTGLTGLTGLSLLLAGCASTGGAALPVGTEPMTNEDAIVIYCAGVEDWATDPRDAGLREAICALDDRLLEIPAELDMKDVPVPALELARDILAASTSLRINFEGGEDTAVPVNVEIAVGGSIESARRIAQQFGSLVSPLLPTAATPVEGHEGLMSVDTGMGSAYYGEAGGQFVVSYGAPKSGDLGLGSMGLPRGVDPDFALKVDVAKLQGPIEMGLALGGEQAAMFRSQLELMGFLTGEPVKIEWATGQSDDRRYIAGRYTNFVPVLEHLGTLEREPLSARDLSLVPADVTLMQLGRLNRLGILSVIEKMGAGQDIEIVAMIQGMIGVDLKTELLQPLGNTFGMYLSESTGGGGLASAVTFMSVTDAKQLEATINKLANLTTGLAYDVTQGYATIRPWKHGSASCWSLSFPGLPVPIEFSAGLIDDYVFVTLTPRALVVALDQAQDSGANLLDNDDFRSVVGDVDDLLNVAYQDTHTLIRDGYGYTSFLFSALANGVRSRTEERGPGLIMPSLAELRANAAPGVFTSRFDGDDLVVQGQADRSVTANLAALLGTPYPAFVSSIAGFAGVLAGRMNEISSVAMGTEHPVADDESGTEGSAEADEAGQADQADQADQAGQAGAMDEEQ